MGEFEKFYGFIEFLFFLGGFLIFLFGIFLRNGFFGEISKLFLIFFNLPFILISITYGILSFRNSLIRSRGASSVIDGTLLLIGISLFIIIFFLFLTYPDKI